MTAMSFQDAFDYLRRHAAQPSVEDLDPQAALAEAIILDHRPGGHAEAAIMLDLLIDNLAAGVRSDRRDIIALGSVQAWLVQDRASAIAA